MNIDTTLYHGRPAERRTVQEDTIYDKLEELGIPFTRVDHDAANTMEDCLLIESHLGGKICKNLFLCNRQETAFYLLMMPSHGGATAYDTRFGLRTGTAVRCRGSCPAGDRPGPAPGRNH